jgi:hypothetical protein
MILLCFLLILIFQQPIKTLKLNIICVVDNNAFHRHRHRHCSDFWNWFLDMDAGRLLKDKEFKKQTFVVNSFNIVEFLWSRIILSYGKKKKTKSSFFLNFKFGI